MVREKSTLGNLEPFDHRHDRIRVRCTDPQLLYADLPPISEEVDRPLLASKQRSGNPKKRLARFRKFLSSRYARTARHRTFPLHSRLQCPGIGIRKAAFMGDSFKRIVARYDALIKLIYRNNRFDI